MKPKSSRFLLLYAVVLAACPLYFPGQSLFGPVGPLTYSGAQPIAASPQYIPGQPQIVRQSTADTQVNGHGGARQGGPGVLWVWHF
ncbi:MAG: hypothetical protein ACP5IL_10600 [Syntrophobacteraceae bacterium]